MEDDEKVITTRYTPLGVVGAICPWYVQPSDTPFIPALLTLYPAQELPNHPLSRQDHSSLAHG